MQSTFFGLNIALQGLYASRSGMDVTNHNITNSKTKGYSRQEIQQRASTPLALNTGKGMVGTGTEVYGIRQLRDTYLDTKYRSENSTLGEYTTKSSSSSQIETIFDAFSDTNFSKMLDTYYDSIQKLSTNAGSEPYRDVVKQSAISYTQYFNSVSQKLQSAQQDLNFNINATVEQINSYTEQIQSLNGQIYKSEIDGSVANDLRDQRNVIVDDLSQLVNVDVSESDQGQFRVSMDGQILVDHLDVNQLEVKQRKEIDSAANLKLNTDLYNKYKTLTGSTNDNDIYAAYTKDYDTYKNTNTENLYDICWAGSGVQLDTTDANLSGKLKGYLDMRDGNSNTVSAGSTGLDKATNYKGIPYYLDKLNQFTQTFAKLMNEGKSYDGTQIAKGGFANGYSLNGTTGIGMFSTKNPDGTYNSGKNIDYTKITAANFGISKEVNEDVNNIATSFSEKVDKEANDLIKEVIGLKHNSKAFSQGEIVDYMTAVTSELAINQSQAKSFAKNQENITLSIDNQRLSVAGVNLNEEMANMIKYQQTYAAAIKMITTMDEILNTTINKLGTT
jgi:flagellar hook-associated protein 1 FlgK